MTKLFFAFFLLTASVAAGGDSTEAGVWYPAGDCVDTANWRVSYDSLRERIAKNIDWGRASARRGPHIAGTFRVDDGPVKIFYDTTRYYAKVDTVAWWLVCGLDSIRVDDVVIREEILRCGWEKSPILDTIWLPKIQVWLDSTRYKKLMEMPQE